MIKEQIGTITRVEIRANGEKMVKENLNMGICEGDAINFTSWGEITIMPKAEVERRKKYERFWHFFGIDSYFPYKRKE